MLQEVMVVDDEEALLYSVKRILELSGLKVETVKSGRECIERLKKGFKGLILMDILMPDMDGWDTIQEIINEGFAEGNIICIS